MKIYNYNRITKEFMSQTVAGENPLEEGKYLIPASATSISPLKSKDGFAVCFNEENKIWEYIEDNRTKTIYSTDTKEEVKVDYIGKIKDGFTQLVPNEFDKWDGAKWIVDEILVKENEEKLKQIEVEQAKRNGEIYTLNNVDYKVSFMKDDADGLMQVSMAFQLGLTNTVIHFENGTKMPIKNTEFEPFAIWFVGKRNSFFVEQLEQGGIDGN